MTGKKKNCPCQDCEERNAECHANCDAYKLWKIKLDEQNEARRAARDQDIMSDAKKKSIWRKQRYSRRSSKISGKIKND